MQRRVVPQPIVQINPAFELRAAERICRLIVASHPAFHADERSRANARPFHEWRHFGRVRRVVIGEAAAGRQANDAVGQIRLDVRRLPGPFRIPGGRIAQRGGKQAAQLLGRPTRQPGWASSSAYTGNLSK